MKPKTKPSNKGRAAVWKMNIPAKGSRKRKNPEQEEAWLFEGEAMRSELIEQHVREMSPDWK